MSRTAQEWDERYAAAGDEPGQGVWTASPNPALADLLSTELNDRDPGACIDVAAGEGRHAVWLASLGWQVLAVDYSRVGLDRAERTAAAAGAEIVTVCADVTGWQPEAAVDLVLCAYLHLASTTTSSLVARMATWVGPRGRLVLLGHDLDNLAAGVGGPQDPDVLWTSLLLTDAVESAGLSVTTSRRVLRSVSGAERPALDVLVVAERFTGPAASPSTTPQSQPLR